MALMPSDWELEQENARKKRDEKNTLRERLEFISQHSNATKEELLGIIFDHQKRLQKLEEKLSYVSSRSQQI